MSKIPYFIKSITQSGDMLVCEISAQVIVKKEDNNDKRSQDARADEAMANMRGKYGCGCIDDPSEIMNDIHTCFTKGEPGDPMLMLALLMLCRKHQIEANDIILDRMKFTLTEEG